MTRAERIRELHRTRFGGSSTIEQLAIAAVEAGIFAPDVRRSTAMAACRRALSATDDKGLPYAMRLPRGVKPYTR